MTAYLIEVVALLKLQGVLIKKTKYRLVDLTNKRHISLYAASHYRFDFNESAIPKALFIDAVSVASIPYSSREGMVNTIPASTLSGLAIISLFASYIYTQKALWP